MSLTAEQSNFYEHTLDDPVVQETDPAVIMDIGMGKVIPDGKVLEVDYPALRQTLKASGAPEDNSDLIVAIAPHHRFESLRGYHEVDSDEYRPEGEVGPVIVIGSNPGIRKFGPAFTQSILQHELSHYVDGQNGVPQAALYGPANAIMARGRGLGGFAVASTAIQYASYNFGPIPPGMSAETADKLYGLLDQATMAGTVAATGLIALASAYYRLSSDERRAHQLQDVSRAPFVVLEDARTQRTI